MPETIEAEVVSIDGQPPRPEGPRPEPERPAWEWAWGPGRMRMRGSLQRLDRRWWPLWVLLAILLVGVVLVLGVFAAGLYAIVALLRGGMRLLFGHGRREPGRAGSLRPR